MSSPPSGTTTNQKKEKSEEEVDDLNDDQQPTSSANVENIDFTSQLSNNSSDETATGPGEQSGPDNELRRRRLERFESLKKQNNENENEENGRVEDS